MESLYNYKDTPDMRTPLLLNTISFLGGGGGGGGGGALYWHDDIIGHSNGSHRSLIWRDHLF